MAVIIVKRPRAVIRETLSDPLMRAKLDAGSLSYIDSILAKPDEDWSRREFRVMHQYFGDCDD